MLSIVCKYIGTKVMRMRMTYTLFKTIPNEQKVRDCE